MKLGNGIEMLEITADFMGRRTIIYPVIVSDADEVILVDTGFPGSDGIEQIREQAIKAGIPFERLSKVILTHQDIDHIGGLPELIRKQKSGSYRTRGRKALHRGDEETHQVHPGAHEGN